MLRLVALVASGVLAHGTAIPWDKLNATLSEDAFQMQNIDDWLVQCVYPFNFEEKHQNVSNYELFEQPSGLCAAHLSCSWIECDSPYPKYGKPYKKYDPDIFTDDVWKYSGNLNLPAVVVHPTNVADISKTIKFAAANKKEMSVKTSGHSYTGSSTKKGSILINLTKLMKYSPKGSIVQCEPKIEGPQDAYQNSCNLAIARNKEAVIRVGGGEIWTDVYSSVIKWNKGNNKKYHVLGGAAGTVSAAGGWLQSGGLSGNSGMRQYGLGIDQVLHVEMVLPSGMHVRFGPTDWKDDVADMMYPRTTYVTGYCNHGDLNDEGSWNWQVCEDAIDFKDLWYAVRGGGGGTFGVVTSVYYQLHEYSPLQRVSVKVLDLTYATKWMEFLLKFLFSPELIGVEKSISNACSSPGSGGFLGGYFYCYNRAGEAMLDAWTKYLVPNYSIYVTLREFDSYAATMIEPDEESPDGLIGVPVGKAKDSPKPKLNPSHSTSPVAVNEYFQVALDTAVNKRDELLKILTSCFTKGQCFVYTMYIMGGNIPFADDGMNSLSANRRHGAFLLSGVVSQEYRTKLLRLFYDVKKENSGASFDGGLCHNHASVDFPTPLKANLTKACNVMWSKEDKEEKCMSFQETAWGTKNLKKLERIHTNVDPDRLLSCWGGVQYIKEVKNPTTSLTSSPTSSPTVKNVKASKVSKGKKGSKSYKSKV